ncbi:MAG: S8 family peptidase [Anaerocolumna sp.]
MDETDQLRYNDEDYADLIVFYLNRPELLKKYSGAIIHYMNEAYAVVHVPLSQISINTVTTYGYSAIPKLYGLTSEKSLEASGVNRLRAIPNFNLRGSGVLVAIIDTGIDYTNPVFLKPDGTTKILSIWDQSMNTGPQTDKLLFGTEYKSVQINQALTSTNPYDIVPSRDDNGHGTMMAAVAAGNENINENFTGIVPDAELLIVKLRQAKQYLRDFYVIPEDVDCYQENHIMWGVQYCTQIARDLNRPIAICTGIGTSQGSHNGRSYLSTFLSIVGDFPNTAIVTPIGNEGNRRRHYYSTIDPAAGFNSVELNVSKNDSGFTMELWGDSPGIYTIDITSPSGEYIPRISAGLRESSEIKFIFERTIINIDNIIAESQTGEQLILMRFHTVNPGTWKFKVYGQSNLSAGFHIWLPMGNMISNSTYFTKPNIYTTLLAPGSAAIPISITAYNDDNNSLYIESSRGYTRSDTVKPDLAAPGVNYIAPNQNKEFVSYSGTSVAAAHATGIVAMLLEWGSVKGNKPDLDSLEIKNYLIRGAKRDIHSTYPNKDWGYGIIDIFNVFNIFKTDTGM